MTASIAFSTRALALPRSKSCTDLEGREYRCSKAETVEKRFRSSAFTSSGCILESLI